MAALFIFEIKKCRYLSKKLKWIIIKEIYTELFLSVRLKKDCHTVKYYQTKKEEQRDMIANSFDIARNIRLVRETKGLTIEKLAELAGVSPNHMSKVENGLRNLSMESYLNVLQALDVYPVFIAGTAGGEETKKYISNFINIIKGCSGREVEFLLNMAVSKKENMIKTGLTANGKK